jgi:hypothetical protein
MAKSGAQTFQQRKAESQLTGDRAISTGRQFNKGIPLAGRVK